jgi:nitroreductase
LPFIDVAFGIQSMLLAAHAYGVAGTVLNWMHRTKHEEKRLRRLLDIPNYHQIIFNIAMGYPNKMPHAPGRKGPDLTYAIH